MTDIWSFRIEQVELNKQNQPMINESELGIFLVIIMILVVTVYHNIFHRNRKS